MATTRAQELIPAVLWAFLMIACGKGWAQSPEAEKNLLGPQSTQAKGELHVLVAAVRFPDVKPTFSLEHIRRRAVSGLDAYVKEQSYGLARMKADVHGWVDLPDPVTEYSVSPRNFEVDRTRVRKLIEDTMTALEKQVDLSEYAHLLIIPGAFTTPGKGYGMLCYCANPGMLSGVRRDVEFVTLKSKRGKEFKGGVFVAAENAHLGMFAHDFFHALGGIQEKKRLVPCLYDYERQSDSTRTPSPEHHAIYVGPWDIMSEHFTKRDEPPPGLCSFTKIRLGWIEPGQVVLVDPGDTAMTFLSPLAGKGEKLVVKIPLKGGEYYLVENRQPVGFDRSLPDSGLLILKVNPAAVEGSGTVKVMDAAPKAPHFSQAVFRLDRGDRNLYVDGEAKVAVVPLWSENSMLGTLVTTPEKGPAARDAAVAMQNLLVHCGKNPSEEEKQLLEECLAAFRKFDFGECARKARETSGD